MSPEESTKLVCPLGFSDLYGITGCMNPPGKCTTPLDCWEKFADNIMAEGSGLSRPTAEGSNQPAVPLGRRSRKTPRTRKD